MLVGQLEALSPHTTSSVGSDRLSWITHIGGRVSIPVEIDALLIERKAEIANAGCTVETVLDAAELCGRAALAIADGKVIGWFQGRMEWGPRALGNRSILADPRRADMKELLNLKIKRRESFRPFAPSVLDKHVAEWFEEDDDVPFMMQVFQIRAEKRPLIPAVAHVDGSGRLQTVSQHTNPLYYSLIDSFRNLTGVPMVLNTSFNENEPVVCDPRQALDCFLRTRMDMLVLGQAVLHRAEFEANRSVISNSTHWFTLLSRPKVALSLRLKIPPRGTLAHA